MADEQVVNGLSESGNVVWALTDNENTVRDLANTTPGPSTTIVNHRVFSAYGELLSQTNPSVTSRNGRGRRLPVRLHGPAVEPVKREHHHRRRHRFAEQQRPMV